MFVPQASEIEQNRMVQTTPNFEIFDKKRGFFYPFFKKLCRHFGRRSCT